MRRKWKRKRGAAPDTSRLGELSERLRMMRGNITTPMPAGSGSTEKSSGNRVERLSKAARDARFVDRTNEDDVLREVREYRSIDDR